MHVISRKRLRQFWELHPAAEEPLRAWHQAARREIWQNFAEVRVRFPHADRVGRFTVFNIGGNKYRLVTVIHHNRGKVFVRQVLTHKEYDLGKWKDD
ncbi:MAG TPA: type II toxin-antitoxin system HigB family toxin [Gemmataceae bacterium]|nr:type II toxin-antitoxin system HigB family toxin [Gemmataceae bacterium]